MWAGSPVFRVIVFVTVVFLVVGEELVKLERLLKVLNCLHTSDVLQVIKVAESVDTCSDKSVPVNGLQFHVGVVLLELPGHSLSEVDVWPLDAVHVIDSHLELVEIEVLWEYLHCLIINYKLTKIQ